MLVLIFSASSPEHFIWLAFSMGLIALINRLSFSTIIHRIKPFIFYLPVMVVLYLLLSILLTGTGVIIQLKVLIMPVLRMIFILLSMAVFLELVSASEVLDSVRTLWRVTGRKWRWVEFAFQMLYLVFRFFPLFRDEFNTRREMEQALSFHYETGKFSNITRLARYLPAIVSNIFHRAENLGLAMTIRRFGETVPRGIALPRYFGLVDMIAMGVIILAFLGYNSLA